MLNFYWNPNRNHFTGPAKKGKIEVEIAKTKINPQEFFAEISIFEAQLLIPSE